MNPPTNNASKFTPTLYGKKTVKKTPAKAKRKLPPTLNNKPLK